MYIWLFSRSVGAGSATTRNTRGLTRSVMALMVPPLPAPSRPSNTMHTLRPACCTHCCSRTSSPCRRSSSFSYTLRFRFSSMRPLSAAGKAPVLDLGPICAGRPACCNGLVRWLVVLAAAWSVTAGAVTGLDVEPKPQFGDFDRMVERRVVRVAVPYSRTLYFNDRGAQRGITADTLRDFEVFLNKKYPHKVQPFVVVAFPTTREHLLSAVL